MELYGNDDVMTAVIPTKVSKRPVATTADTTMKRSTSNSSLSSSSTTSTTLDEVKEELSRVCDMFKERKIGGDQVVRRVRRILEVDSREVPHVKTMQSCLSKRVEATLGVHLCGLWRQCKNNKCQYEGNLAKWREEIRVYRPFGEAIPEIWTTQGLISQAVRDAHDKSLETLKTRLSETEEELERARLNRRRSNSDQVDREEAFKGLLAHMDFSAKDNSLGQQITTSKSKSPSIGVLKEVGSGSSSSLDRKRSTRRRLISSKFRPRVSPSIAAAAMLSLPPVLNIDDEEEEEDNDDLNNEEKKKDWPYRDVFPQFLREKSDEREGNLSAIMNHMNQIQRTSNKKDEHVLVDKKNEKKKNEKVVVVLKDSSVVVKLSSWFALFTLWISKMSLRRKVIVAVAMFGILSRLSFFRARSAATSTVLSKSRGVARFLPSESIFRRIQESSPSSSVRRAPPLVGGIARFLPPDSIFSRLSRK